MPDYAVIHNLCEELNVSVSELMDGEEADDKSVRVYDDEQILDLLRRTLLPKVPVKVPVSPAAAKGRSQTDAGDSTHRKAIS